MARTVLLADDSVTAQNMGRRILMDAGYEVVTVNNGSAALKKIHENHPDLIVLDVYMPGYGGLEVCQRLKEAADTARIPVLLSVGKMEPFKAEEAKRVRADGHIVKPFEASELLAALTKLEDKIVPQADAAGGRHGKSEKSEKKSRSWRGGDPLAGAEEAPTERVAYLNEVKKRRTHEAPGEAPVGSDQLASEGSAEAPNSADVATPVVARAAANEEFAVQESAVPSESDSQPATIETQAAEAVVERPAIFDAPTVEIPAAEVSAHEALATEPPANPATVSEEAIAEASTLEANAQASAETPAAPAASVPVSTARWVAENVALSVEEASIALEAEMQQAHAVSATGTAPKVPAQEQVTSSVEVVAQAPSPETQSENSSGAAFAAAAAASGQESAVSSQPVEVAAGNRVSAPEAEPAIPSEAAAAWDNWQHIRDSVMSPQKAAAIAESVAEMAHASLPPMATEDHAAKPDSAPSDISSTAPAEEDNSINDIVDSVLADLKPRLMQEIAKKLAAKK